MKERMAQGDPTKLEKIHKYLAKTLGTTMMSLILQESGKKPDPVRIYRLSSGEEQYLASEKLIILSAYGICKLLEHQKENKNGIQHWFMGGNPVLEFNAPVQLFQSKKGIQAIKNAALYERY